MIKALYTTCWLDPWLEVAKELESKNNIKPVCWIGYDTDDSEELVQQEFSYIYYLKYYDSWKGKFPKYIDNKINENISNYLLDVDFIKKMIPYEMQAIKMMDRMDRDRHSFSFMERQRHFRLLLRKWSYLIDYLEIDVVISATVPHRVYDYVIYHLCKQKGIPFFAFRGTAFSGRVIPVDNIYKINNEIGQTQYKNKLLKENLPEDIRQNLNKLRKKYTDAEPSYMKQHKTRDEKHRNLLGNINQLIFKTKSSTINIFSKDSFLLVGFPSFNKLRGLSIEDSYTPLITHVSRKIKSVRYKNKLKSYYENITSNVDYDKKYLFFAMHYQPEMTTNPAGDIFADQTLCIDTLLKFLPNDYYIYIKEHKSQFYAHTEGHTSRMKTFYDDLLKYNRVSFVPLDEDNFKLIDNAAAVSTVTGTIGWEALAKGKPVIIFGMSWYENYEGVLKVKNSQDAQKMSTFIKHFQFDEVKLIEYLHSLCENSTVAYYYRGIKEKINLKEEDCINNIYSQIMIFLNSNNLI